MSRIEKLLKAIINNTTYDEPRLSRIEEIFYSILNSLPYNANAQSRIEALLLALKESGLYDERTLSRIEEILKCKLDGRTYTGWIGSRVEMLLNEWELSEIIETTFTSFPIIIKANGEPLLDYTIYGNMSQTGTPTPDNPIMPQGTGERTGNLLDYTTVESTTYATATLISGGITISGQYFVEFGTMKFTVGNAYTMSWKANTISGTSSPSWRFHYYDGTYSSMVASGGTLIAEKEVSELLLYVSTSQSCVVEFTEIMLNLGSTALPYEPYGYKLDISSANTTTPVYLGEVETTRRIKKLVLTGNESVSKDTGQDPTLYFLRYKHIQINSYCTHLRSVSSKPQSGEFSTVAQYDGYIFMNFGADIMDAQQSGNTVEGFKEYLAAQYAAGTPVTIWYVLAEPTTGIVNEPLRKIGDYADTVSMEQAGVEIPTLNKPNNTVIDVETTLKPSKMYVKYNGEGKRVYITADGKLYITSNNEIYILKR